MQKSIAFIACALVGLVGCNAPPSVGPDQVREAVNWANEYPELAPELKERIEDNNLDEEEFESFRGKYHTLVNQSNMDKVRQKLDGVIDEDLRTKYEALAEKTRKEAAKRGLVIRENEDGTIAVVKPDEKATLQKADASPPEIRSDIVLTEDLDIDPTKIDEALDKALKKPIIVEEE